MAEHSSLENVTEREDAPLRVSNTPTDDPSDESRRVPPSNHTMSEAERRNR